MRFAAFVLIALGAVADAAPPEPSGPHPRILLDDALRAAWKSQARAERGPVPGAIALCESGQTGKHDRGIYQGAEWARLLQSCLVAWVATEDPVHATTAIKFMNALLDDRDQIGDRQGGDTAASRDSGYAIRNHGPYTALAYDWLHGAPGMTPELKHKARGRWAAWLAWYRDKGYRARVPGTNYQAAYIAAATLIAVAQGGEAGDQGGPATWAFVADELWGKDMTAALAPGGVLDGGDWPEGWQYGPLAVAHYALAARVARAHGIAVDGIERWLASLLRRHVHGLSPSDRVFVGQDTEHAEANIAPHALTLSAVALGDASADDRRWARGELARLRIVDKDYFLYDALAFAGDKGVLVPRDRWPTWYATPATGTIYARTRWDDRAVWFVAECQRGLDVDHRHPKAGNFVLSRGKDDVIVDPSPYGSRSTLTSNAPTVASAHFPADYIPSQATWSEHVGWEWATHTRSGVVAARCDYADAYKFQHRASDVSDAKRDLVLVPSRDGTDAALLVIDRAHTEAADRVMNLRFRVPGGLELQGELGSKTIGATKLTIAPVARSAGKPSIGRSPLKNCFDKGVAKGRCDAARFDVADYRIEIAGPSPSAVHVIGAVDASGTAPAAKAIGGGDWAGVELAGPRPATVVWPTTPGHAVRYRAAPGTHVILDGPDGNVSITAKRDGATCAVAVDRGGATPARPAIVLVDDACTISVDPASASAASARGTRPPPVHKPGRVQRSGGCCNTQATPGSSLGIALIVGMFALRRRKIATR